MKNEFKNSENVYYTFNQKALNIILSSLFEPISHSNTNDYSKSKSKSADNSYNNSKNSRSKTIEINGKSSKKKKKSKKKRKKKKLLSNPNHLKKFVNNIDNRLKTFSKGYNSDPESVKDGHTQT